MMTRLRATAFKAAVKIAGALQALPARVTPPPVRLMQMGSAFWQSRALAVAAKLDLADAIGDGARSTADLAAALSLNQDALERLLRMLASNGIFAEGPRGCFRNTPTSACLRHDHPQSVRAMVLMHNAPEMTAAWLALEDAVRDGAVPFERCHGAELYAYMSDHRDFDLLFSQAMDTVEAMAGDVFTQGLDWGSFARVIDVGGSKGSKIIPILRHHPGLTATVFDRPQVIAVARPPDDLAGRLEFVAGDMLDSLPAARSDRDVYAFSAVFHGLDDDAGRRLLDKVRAAAAPHRARVVIADMVMPEQAPSPMATAFDLQMLVNTRGRERTLAEWKALLAGAGFNLERVVDLPTFASLLVAVDR
jgi:hypothetical protein